MNEKRYTVGLQSKTIFDMKTELYLFDNKIICELLNAQNSLICEQQALINKQEEIIKSQDMEISRQYNLCLAMSGVLREEFGVYDVFDRTKDKNIKKEE